MPPISIYGMFAGHNLAADTRLIEHFFGWIPTQNRSVNKAKPDYNKSEKKILTRGGGGIDPPLVSRIFFAENPIYTGY